MKVVVFFDSYYQKHELSKNLSKAEQLIEELGKGNQLLNSLIESNDRIVSESKIINSALNQGISSFTPSNIFEQMIKNFSIAKSLYGDTLLRELTGYSVSDIEKNINIPEFQRELYSNIIKNIDKIREHNFVSADGSITDVGALSSAILLFKEELDRLIPSGILGEKINKKYSVYGDKGDVQNYKKGDRYRDIALKSSAKKAIRRGHKRLMQDDLKSFQRQSKGSIYVVYAIDASASMRGEKIGMCKKAGIALAYKAIEHNDKVGLIVFGSEIKELVMPTDDFPRLLVSISAIKASRETNISMTINKAVELFPNINVTKHLIILTDAMPTVGISPEKETLSAASNARSSGITVSVVGIKLNDRAEKLAREIVKIGEGRFYIAKDIENLDMVVLEDYYSL